MRKISSGGLGGLRPIQMRICHYYCISCEFTYTVPPPQILNVQVQASLQKQTLMKGHFLPIHAFHVFIFLSLFYPFSFFGFVFQSYSYHKAFIIPATAWNGGTDTEQRLTFLVERDFYSMLHAETLNLEISWLISFPHVASMCVLIAKKTKAI